MFKPKPHAYGMKTCEIVYQSDVFWISKVDPCLFISKTVICLVYADDCTFWERSQYDIDNVMKSSKEDGTS